MNIKKRNPAADIIRCFALFSVVFTHFFSNSGFYSHPMAGKRMLVMTVIRSLFIICVPLFITLSGYLLRKKELSKKYYKRISKILITYLLISIICMAYSAVFLNEKLTLSNMVIKILNFTGAPYSWYIEMYLGLFLMIPFLNILYNNISTKKWKLMLIITFLILTSLPTVINVYNFSHDSWWISPSATDAYKLMPSWWTGIYPITYYFIGCYLSEYGLKIKTSLNIILLFFSTVASGLYSYISAKGNAFVWGSWCGYNSPFNVILTVLVFTLFFNLSYTKFPERLSLFLQKASGLCLGGYLISWIFDSRFYPILLKRVPLVQDRFPYCLILVPLIFICSLFASYIIAKLQLFLEFIFSRLWAAVRKGS